MKSNRVLVFAVLAVGVSAASAQVMLPEGTRVRVRLEQALSSATAEQGQAVNFSVIDDVKIGEIIVVAQGATCVGEVIQALPKRRMGRTGKLDFTIERVAAVDGSSVPLRYSPTKREGGSHATRTGILTAAGAVIFWPAAPVFLLMKGKDVTVNKGMTFEVFTDQRFTLSPKATTVAPAGSNTVQPAQPVMTPGPVSTPAPAAALPGAMATITSDPNGAEIELDGAFVGSTPTTLQLAAGPHAVTVKKGAASWTRTMQIQSGSTITLHAPLAPKD
jgi:hypothetical protein